MMVDRADRQIAVAKWVDETFGRDNLMDIRIRAMRFIEEAFELVQSFGLPKEDVLKVMEMTYSREPGVPVQEFGGVGVTLLAMATACGINADDCEERELKRVLSKPKEHFRKRNEEKPQ